MQNGSKVYCQSCESASGFACTAGMPHSVGPSSTRIPLGACSQTPLGACTQRRQHETSELLDPRRIMALRWHCRIIGFQTRVLVQATPSLVLCGCHRHILQPCKVQALTASHALSAI